MDTDDLTQVDDTARDFGASYFAATMRPAPRRPALNLDLDIDVCVIGAGFAGLTVAREIARRGWSVVVLEARRIAWSASGRNAGFVLPGFGHDLRAIIERGGFERARTLWALSQAGADYVRDTIAESGMEGVAPTPGGWLRVSKTDDAGAVAQEANLLQDVSGTDVEVWPTARVRAHLNSAHYFQGIHVRNAFHIHPLNYALGLAALAEEAGARIYENTPALSVDPVGIRKRIVTPHARVRASHVILAGSVHLGDLVPQVARTLMPLTSYVVATAPLGERAREAIDFEGCVSDTALADNHYRLEGDRLIWSGRATLKDADPQRFGKRLQRDIARTFPQLGKVEIEFSWCGRFGHAVHRMPQIGEVSPGLWIASGFGRHGLNTTAMAGNLIAHAVVEGSRAWRHFEPFELVWTGGAAGRLVSRFHDMLRSGQERLAAGISRRREKQRANRKESDSALARQLWTDMSAAPSGEPAAADSRSPADTHTPSETAMDRAQQKESTA